MSRQMLYLIAFVIATGGLLALLSKALLGSTELHHGRRHWAAVALLAAAVLGCGVGMFHSGA